MTMAAALVFPLPATEEWGEGENHTQYLHDTLPEHDFDFFFSQAVEVIDQPVNLRVLEAGGLHGK